MSPPQSLCQPSFFYHREATQIDSETQSCVYPLIQALCVLFNQSMVKAHLGPGQFIIDMGTRFASLARNEVDDSLSEGHCNLRVLDTLARAYDCRVELEVDCFRFTINPRGKRKGYMRIVSTHLYQIQRSGTPGLISLKHNHKLYAPRAYTLATLKDRFFINRRDGRLDKQECYAALCSHYTKVTKIYSWLF